MAYFYVSMAISVILPWIMILFEADKKKRGIAKF